MITKATPDTLYEVGGQPVRQEDAIVAGGLVCEWFALCENTAATAQEHPVLGSVPICSRCKAFYDAAS